MSNEIVKQENPSDVLAVIIETGPEILMLNQDRLNRVMTAYDDVVKEIEAEGMSDEMDAYLNKFQVRTKEVLNEMNDERKGLTQSLDKIKKAFTELEAPLDPSKPDSIFNKIGKYRTDYARQLAEERRKKEAEAKRLQEIQMELDKLQTDATLKFREAFNMDLADAKSLMLEAFENATLENFDEIEHKVHNWNTTYSQTDHEGIKVTLRAIYHIPDRVNAIIEETRAGMFDAFRIEYETEMNNTRRQLAEKLPGKKQHLAAEAEAKRRQEEAAKAEAEARARAQAAKNEEDRIRAEKEAEEAKIRAQKQEEEQRRLEEERRRREEDARTAEAEKARLAEQKAKADAEADKAIKDADALFQTEMDLADTRGKTAAKEVYVIEVKHAQGWLLIVSFYFQKKGAKEDAEGLGKKTLNNMRKFAEDEFNKNGEKIESPLIAYIADYKVQARK